VDTHILSPWTPIELLSQLPITRWGGPKNGHCLMHIGNSLLYHKGFSPFKLQASNQVTAAVTSLL